MNRKAKLPLFIFIDAFGWEILKKNPFFLKDLAPYRKKLDTILGYSSACDPSIISGVRPEVHRLWSSYYYAPDRSPFQWLKWFRMLPESIMNRGRVRSWLSRIIKKVHGFTGYFQIYNVPFHLLSLFDYAEKKRIWVAGGLPDVPSIFDLMQEREIPHYVHDSALSDEEKLRRLRSCVEEQSIEFAYISFSKLDALMHAKGPDSAEVTDLVKWYDREIRSLIDLAETYYEDVPFWVFTDHGMHRVKETVDLQQEAKSLEIVFGVDYVAFYDSTMARFWCLNAKARTVLEDFLVGHSGGKLLSDVELKNLGVYFPDHQYGELIFLVNPHVLIVPSFMGAKKIAGMHGYHPDSADSAASMTSNQPLPVELERIEQIYHLMENSLNRN